MSKLFSILHTSARPLQWRAVYDDWMNKADHPEDVEYVLCVDPRWGFSEDPEAYRDLPDNIHVVMNKMRRCYVDGVNIAAKASTGSILIVNADDQFAEESWDSLLCVEIASHHKSSRADAFVIEVSTGTTKEHERGILVMPILSRKRYEDQGGHVFHPAYESMFADNDFCEWAKQDGVILDARNLMFPHRHWINRERESDAVDQVQNRPEAYTVGHDLLTKRRASKFGTLRRTIALCLPGELFRGEMLDAILNLWAHLFHAGWDVIRVRGYETIVHQTRESMARAIRNSPVKPDLTLWIDDDNPLTPAQFEKLVKDLDEHPEVDGVCGWCWIHKPDKTGFIVSCGEWAPDHLKWNPFPPSFRNETALRPMDCGGFPVVLMRLSALEKAGEGAFLPILDNRLEFRISGEDMAFFYRAEQGGAKFLADPEVRVDHLKYVAVEPVFPEEGRVPVKVACMMRVKNEARWIARTIESVKTLCGADIFVMEDGSTDGTRAIALASGATVLDSPFDGMGLDERRDKNWLLAEVMKRCNPDWIFMPDGDEELEPDGARKILAALECNPPVDVFAVRFLYLWNTVDKIRVDGLYGRLLRESLFRARTDLKFESYYEGPNANTNHVGLHCSNSPGMHAELRKSPLNVFLLHYGYLHKEDRVRKYRWICSIDPTNEEEDFYRHTVQGDLPEIPADLKLKHGGPLDLRPLPARLVPKFDCIPGPRQEEPEKVMA